MKEVVYSVLGGDFSKAFAIGLDPSLGQLPRANMPVPVYVAVPISLDKPSSTYLLQIDDNCVCRYAHAFDM
jgi:hypothetical protein